MTQPTGLDLVPDLLVVPAQWGLPFAIDEPDVSLTDLGLALETALFAVLIAKMPQRWSPLRRWGAAFFGSAAIASLAGAIDHGFLRRDGRDLGHDVMWAGTLLAIGATSLALVGIASAIGLKPVSARRVTSIAIGAVAIYAVVVMFLWHDFLIAILAYAPAAIFLLGVLIKRYVQIRDDASLPGMIAVILAFTAAGVQQGEFGIHDRYLGHNAFYHLIQAVSFGLLFVALRRFLASPGKRNGSTSGIEAANG